MRCNKLDNKRLEEINARKIEIRKSLEDDKEVNFEAVKKELEDLSKEENEIRNRQDLAKKINVNEVSAKEIEKPTEERSMNIDLDSMEYRKAFMDYVQSGEMAQEYRDSALTKNNAAVIPVTVLNQIVEKMESYGNILPLVSTLSYPAGVSVPVSNMGITATWTAEGAGSEKQGAATTSFTFGAYKLQCRVGVSMEMHVKALSAFEAAIINNVSKAMVKAIEQAIVSGDGAAKPKGITTEDVDASRKIDVAKFDYKTLTSIESAVPAAYDATSVYCMNKKTYMQFAGMTDAQGQPIARVNMGISGQPERTLYGRTVVLTDYLPSYDAVEAGQTFGFVFDFSNYVLNTGYDMNVRQYVDEETDDTITKATMLVDGKVVDNNGLVLLVKPSK